MELTRRNFLVSAGAATLLLSLDRLGLAQAPGAVGSTAAVPLPDYRTWEDVYRQKWTWDRVVRCSHNRANCMSACAWNVYVKDGIVWREEQAQVYDEGGRGGAPDFFPRGCQKGACYSKLMASPQRLRYPLERVGPRGSGKWKRISWDEALDKIADGIIAAATAHGTETVVATPGPNFDHGPDSAAEFRFLRILGATTLDTFSGIGDMPIGTIQTYGMFMNDGTSDDYFNSDYIVLWSANPLYTRIPDIHFLTEARYRGAHLVVVAPDYNATAIHADLWLNPKSQSDVALALAMAQVIIAEKLYKEEYVKEQTDLPFLVRTDTGRFLRERDLVKSGRDNAFYLWDEKQGAAVLAPGSQGMKKPTLALGDIKPALEGRRQVTACRRHACRGGAALRDPAPAAERQLHARDGGKDHRGSCHGDPAGRAPDGRGEGGVDLRLHGSLQALSQRPHAPLVRPAHGAHRQPGKARRRPAPRRWCAKAALIYASTGACKHYHSDLMHRSFALLMALTGNQGRPGGGLRLGAWWGVTGFDELGFEELPAWQKLVLRLTGRPAVRDVEAFLVERSRAHAFTPVLPWLQVHGGYAQTMGNPAYNDAGNPLGMDEAMKTAVERGWMPMYPAPGKSPKVFLVNSDNPLRQWPAPQIAIEHLWPKFDLVVNINTQMSTTGMHSDVLLPAAAYYEKIGIKYAWGFLPYLVLNDKAVEPLGESRNEWWIYGSLAQRVQERAQARGCDAREGCLWKGSGSREGLRRLEQRRRLQSCRPAHRHGLHLPALGDLRGDDLG